MINGDTPIAGLLLFLFGLERAVQPGSGDLEGLVYLHLISIPGITLIHP
jgi:hypothetical protein